MTDIQMVIAAFLGGILGLLVVYLPMIHAVLLEIRTAVRSRKE